MLTKEESRKVLKQAQEILKPGGIIMVSGAARKHFYSEDYKKPGFFVINTYDPNNKSALWVIKKPIKKNK
ncbi:hypothetical protein ACFL2K_04705 [Candidatus Margulisiibacteriota bacterium]